MFVRSRIAVVLALLLALITFITAFAKGNFAFISITGPDLKDTVHVSDPALIDEFFAFANFFRAGTQAPANPGVGYEITRYYVNDGKHEIAFDRLHYYPDTGFVYYDGIVNGWSEYDGKWYTAQPGLKKIFETAVSTQMQLIASGMRMLRRYSYFHLGTSIQ
jgi:hypothetical protein